MCRLLFSVFKLLTLSMVLSGWVSATETSADHFVRVGVFERAPFVQRDVDDKPNGFSIDAWRYIATRNAWHSEFVWYANAKDALRSLRDRDIDVLVTPVIIDPADRLLHSFSRPYLLDNYAVMGRANVKVFYENLRVILAGINYVHLFLIVLVIVVVLHILHFLSRRAGIRRPYHASILDEFLDLFAWGVEGPKGDIPYKRGFAQRLVLVIWCLFFEVLIAGLIATFSAALVVSHTQKKEMHHRFHAGDRIGYLRGQPFPSDFLRQHVIAIQYDSLPALQEALILRRVDDIVEGRLVLERLQENAHKLGHSLVIFADEISLVSSRFILPSGHNMVEPIDTGLRALSQDPITRREICVKYNFPRDNDCLL